MLEEAKFNIYRNKMSKEANNDAFGLLYITTLKHAIELRI